jgi:chitin disaccharide deacetylase
LIKIKQIFFSLLFAAILLPLATLLLKPTLCAQSSNNQNEIRLILRGDDMGISHSSNTAIIKAYKAGLQKSAEVIVNGPWFPEAVRLLNDHPGLDVGIHLTLTSEWENLKWRPLTNSPGLSDSLGYFQPFIWPHEHYGESRALLPQNWTIVEIERELRMQIELAKSTIQNVTHLSYHMGLNNMAPEVNELVKKLAIEYDLDIDLNEYGFERLSFGEPLTSGKEKTDRLIEILKELTPGNYILITHPDLDTPDTRSLHHTGYEFVAQDRQADTDMLTSRELKRAIEELGIQVISYWDLLNM